MKNKFLIFFISLLCTCKLNAQPLTEWVGGEFRYKVSADSIISTFEPKLKAAYPLYHYYNTSIGVLNVNGKLKAISNVGYVVDSNVNTLYYSPGKSHQHQCYQGDMLLKDGDSIYLSYSYLDSVKNQSKVSYKVQSVIFDSNFNVLNVNNLANIFSDQNIFLPLNLIAKGNNNKKWIITRSNLEGNFLSYNLIGKMNASSNVYQVNYKSTIQNLNSTFSLSPDFNYLVHTFSRGVYIPQYFKWGGSDILHILRFNNETGQIVFHSNIDTSLYFEGSCFNKDGKYLYVVCRVSATPEGGGYNCIRQYDWENYIKTGKRVYNDFIFPLNNYTVQPMDHFTGRGLILTSNNLIAGGLLANGYFWIKNPDTFGLQNNVIVRTQDPFVTGRTAMGWPTQPSIQSINNPVKFNWDSAWNAPAPEFKLWVPNSFSPTNDNLNETFSIKSNLPMNPDNFKVSIYNRYGVLIFEEKHNPWFNWNGTYKGLKVETGIYSVEINYQNPITGDISVNLSKLMVLY